MPRRLPVWVTGFANLPLGFFYGFINTAMPLLLSTQGVSVARIATISAIAFSPSFWGFVAAPVVDVAFSRRTWVWVWLAAMALCIGSSVLLTGHLLLFTADLTLGCLATNLFQAAAGGWLAEMVSDEERGHMGAWYQIANLGGAALFGVTAIVIVQHVAAGKAAVLVMLCFLVPSLALFSLLPKPVSVARRTAVVFGTLFHELGLILRKRDVLMGLITFLLPAGAFALNNVFSGLGADFHASTNWVTTVCGAGVAIACSLGCLAGGPLADRYSRMTVYICAGSATSIATGIALFCPRSGASYAALVLLYNFCQGINFTALTAIVFQLTGSENPLAATQMSLLFSAANLPTSYVTWLDGRGYAGFGVPGLLLTDTLLMLVFGTILYGAFYRYDRKMLQRPHAG
ncbi:MFS transporter [Terriglobus tenax]|uniref:MFS transporter n=1 Tax=Terriglobus tenax TaxID=1111115 RepID=UPI0021E0B952|nr:MFS transporter [Terriglobus tenax]